MKNEEPPSPPPKEPSAAAVRVARRSLVLAAVVCRGAIEQGAGDPEADALHQRVLEWLTRFDLWEEIEPSEEQILHTPLGALTPDEVIRATWFVEGLAVLAWALRQEEFPKHDQKVDPYAVTDTVWFLSEDVEEFLRTARLRSRKRLQACRELQYDIHVRLRDFQRHGQTKDITDWIEPAWIDPLGLDATHLLVDNDLAIDGKPIVQASIDRVQECVNIAYERHRAIVWLVERYPNYSQTPADI